MCGMRGILLLPIWALLAPMPQLVTQKTRLCLLLFFNPALRRWITRPAASLAIALLEVLPHLLNLSHSLSGLVLLGVNLHHCR